MHDDNWWRVRFEAAGFVYSEVLTKEVRIVAQSDHLLKNLTTNMNEDRSYSVGQHIWTSMMVRSLRC